jgi:hypothetical protein
MSETAKLRDDDYIDRLFSVSKGIRVPMNGGGYVTTYLTSGTKNITADGVYDVNEYASVNVTAGSVAGSALIGVLDGSATQLTADQLAGLTTLRNYALYASQVESVQLPSSVTFIGAWAFGGCSLSSYFYAPGVTTIDAHAFYGSGVTDLAFPKIQSIYNLALDNIPSLETLSLGEDLTFIGASAFEDCQSLRIVTVEAINPPYYRGIGSSQMFDGCSALTAIYVPAEAVNAYKAASGWSTYASIIQAIP